MLSNTTGDTLNSIAFVLTHIPNDRGYNLDFLVAAFCRATCSIRASSVGNFNIFQSSKPQSFGPGWDSNSQPFDHWANT